MKENRLKELREDRDLLQKNVANGIGISERNYSYLETGGTTLTEDILRKLACFYNTSIDYILYMTDERKPYKRSIMQEENKVKETHQIKRGKTVYKIREF